MKYGKHEGKVTMKEKGTVVTARMKILAAQFKAENLLAVGIQEGRSPQGGKLRTGDYIVLAAPARKDNT